MTAGRPDFLAAGAVVLMAAIWGYNWVALKQITFEASPFVLSAMRVVTATVVLFAAATRGPMVDLAGGLPDLERTLPTPVALAGMTALMLAGMSGGWSRRHGGYWPPAVALGLMLILVVKFD